MVMQDCSLLINILGHIEKIISDIKSQHPDLSDEEIIERLKIKLNHHS